MRMPVAAGDIYGEAEECAMHFLRISFVQIFDVRRSAVVVAQCVY